MEYTKYNLTKTTKVVETSIPLTMKRFVVNNYIEAGVIPDRSNPYSKPFKWEWSQGEVLYTL